jgi:hypothetical protein
MSKLAEKIFGKKFIEHLWRKSDDISERTVTLEEIYNDVPEDLKNIKIKQITIHLIEDEIHKERVLAWLNNENYSNSTNLIKNI